MTETPDSSLVQAESRLRALISAYLPTPEQREQRKLDLQHFAERWCSDPWRAEQAHRNGPEWVEACFDSAALAYKDSTPPV